MVDVTNSGALFPGNETPMHPEIKKFSTQMLVLLAILAIGIIAISSWVLPRFRSAPISAALKVSDALKDEPVAVPDEWKNST